MENKFVKGFNEATVKRQDRVNALMQFIDIDYNYNDDSWHHVAYVRNHELNELYRHIALTSQPISASFSVKCDPINPSAPVINIFLFFILFISIIINYIFKKCFNR